MSKYMDYDEITRLIIMRISKLARRESDYSVEGEKSIADAIKQLTEALILLDDLRR